MPLVQTLKYEGTAELLKKIQVLSEAGRLTPEGIKAEILKGVNSLQMKLDKFITQDPAMLAMKNRVAVLYTRHDPVLITGPTGVGKELIAKALSIPGYPFVAENCAAIPDNLVESIFFGHKKGSFSGATSDHTGLLKEAGEGVIFLDEIGDMPLSIQAKFLRAIQEAEIRPVGSVKTEEINCRFIAATKHDLLARVEKGAFREDLYARLSTFEVHITGLKDRPGDIEPIKNSLLITKEDEVLPPFPEVILNRIYRFNVRAIETALSRWGAYGSYE